MHSGRLQVTWIPSSNATTGTSISVAGYNLRTIIDIRTEDIITLELPYLIYADYLPTVQQNLTNTYSGQLDVMVLNDLRAPESCSQSIAMQIFYSAGDDYELAAPSQCMVGITPYVPQMSGKELIRDSVEQGLAIADTSIGGVKVNKDPLFHSSRCIGEKMLSIKQYLLRLNVLYSNTATPTWNNKTFLNIDPYFLTVLRMDGTTGAITSSVDTGQDLYNLFAPWYAYSRGGTNFFMLGYKQSCDGVARVIPSNLLTTQPINSVVTILGPYSGVNNSLIGSSGLYPAANYQLFSATQAWDQFIHVPYYSRMPFQLNTYYDGTNSPTTDPSHSLSTVSLNVRNATAANGITLGRSVCDDFQLMFFTGCPPLVRSYA